MDKDFKEINSIRIKEAMQLRRFNQADLVRKTGLNKSSVSQYVSGQFEMRQKALTLIACALGVSEAWLMGYDVPMERVQHSANQKIVDPINLKTDTLPVKRIPILGSVSAGNPLLVEDDIIGWVLYPDINGHDHFALYINGDSMDAAGLNDKDLAVVEVTPSVDNGAIAVVKVNGDDATVKKFYQNANIIQLVPQSTNAEHQPQVYDLKTTQIDIVGRVVRITKDI